MSNILSARDDCGDEVRVQLSSDLPCAFVDVDAVVDRTDCDDLVGVEILDVRRQLKGASVLEASSAAYPHWSYDPEIDALYVHVSAGRGQRQRRLVVRAGISQDGGLVDLRIPRT